MSTETTEKPRMKRWLRVVLVLSLALNLIIVGLVAGAAMRFGHKGPPPHVGEHPGSPILRALDHDDRREVGRSIRKTYRAYAATAESEQSFYLKLADVIEADPLQPDALRDASAALDMRMSERRVIAQKAWMEKVLGMSADDRRAYAERMREAAENRKKWKKDRPPRLKD